MMVLKLKDGKCNELIDNIDNKMLKKMLTFQKQNGIIYEYAA